MADEPEELTYDEAVALLPDGDQVHTFVNPGGILVGAHWERADVLAALRNSPVRIVSGPSAQSFGHGLAVFERGRYVFIETRKAQPS